MEYSSKPETIDHMDRVAAQLHLIRYELEQRAFDHDKSKLESPELAYFDKYTPLLKTLEYGSPEYKKSLEELRPALSHHYSVNRHHPECFQGASIERNLDLISCMSLVDIVEMFCDWIAASKRTKGGDPVQSIEISSKRFNINDQLKNIFLNTYHELFKN